MIERETYFVDVLLPLPLPGYFTYRIPHDFNKRLVFGMRVVVPFGKSKLYSGLVVKIHTEVPSQINIKYVVDVVDEKPIVSEKQFLFWQWLSQYYMCHMGEVMAVALPSAFKLASESKIMLHPEFDGDLSLYNEKEIKIIEHLSYKNISTIIELEKVAGIKKSLPIIKTLVEKKAIITDEEISNPFKPKKECYISIAKPYSHSEEDFYTLLDDLGKSKRNAKQVDILLAFLMILQQKKEGLLDLSRAIPRNDLIRQAGITPARLEPLIKKGILKTEEVPISRLHQYDASDDIDTLLLSQKQQEALQNIETLFQTHPVVLLHGVTGSGKTELFIKLIEKTLAEGKQVLYLLPEIALTSQIVNRLRKFFGDKVGVYHSRFNEFEKVEIWNRILNPHQENANSKYQLILGARSALLLPYQNLGLIIVDEEHDPSYKQQDPAPRYHARDGAIMLAQIHEAPTLLGTATPSLESYHNAMQGKYGLVELNERYAKSTLPEIWLTDIIQNMRQKKMHGHFSQFLLEHIDEALQKKEQVIIFQNRRGFALRLFCNTCQAMPSCIHCDVTLTYHKRSDLLKCHYCSYAIEVPKECPSCKSNDIEMKGFGTEKVEEVLSEHFPDAKIARLDLDTTRSQNSYQKIISDFENHKSDILVGTQMVTKGLDFDRVSVVGILNADNLISFPDFRAFERAFQILSQVSGRAGRKDIPGKVIIQSYNTEHPALQYVVCNDYLSMYKHQMMERKQFLYPPLNRLIKITLKHKDADYLNEAAASLNVLLREIFKKRVLGPEYPLVSRIQNLYLKDFWLKLPKDKHLEEYKKILKQAILQFKSQTKYSNIRIIINVDP